MQQSYIGNLLLPDLGGLVADTLFASVVTTGGHRAPSSVQFSDAESIFGALRASGCGTVCSLTVPKRCLSMHFRMHAYQLCLPCRSFSRFLQLEHVAAKCWTHEFYRSSENVKVNKRPAAFLPSFV